MSSTTTIRRQLYTLAIVCLIASTLFTSVDYSAAKKKKKILKAIAAATMIARNLKPKKGILPIPLPLPVPLPIEWEQPPVIVHPKQHAYPEPYYGGPHYGGHYGG